MSEQILNRDGLDIVLLERDGEILGATHLRLIPYLSRGGRPDAVIEDVVIAAHRRGEKLGRRLMDATPDRAWAAGCYEAMLMTGSKTPSTHAYDRACGFAHDVTPPTSPARRTEVSPLDRRDGVELAGSAVSPWGRSSKPIAGCAASAPRYLEMSVVLVGT